MFRDKTVLVRLGSANIPHYESLGYVIPRYYSEISYSMSVKVGTMIEVLVTDLPKGSHVKVHCICEECGVDNEVAYYSLNLEEYLCKPCRTIKIFTGRVPGTEELQKRSDNNWMKGKFGPEHNRWNPNLTDDERNNRRNKEPKAGWWRKKVKERDDYTCQCCGYVGEKDDGILNAHHINCWDKFPEQRVDLDNGVTLCDDCHNSNKLEGIHNLYGKFTTKEDFDEFMRNFATFSP